MKRFNDLVSVTRKKFHITLDKSYDIPAELTVSKKGKKFLYFDSGLTDPERIIIFTIAENIEHFIYYQIVICDGTFKSCPKNFEQLFTLQCVVRNINLPLIYCFMKSRKEETYLRLFNWIINECGDRKINTKSFILDFELASYNALEKSFLDSKFFGCNFHLGQIIWRRIQALKFSQECISNLTIKFHVKMILAISFVPENDVLMMVARCKSYLIAEKSFNVLKLFDFFQNEYLNSKDSNKNIKFWNVYDRTLLKIPRTINSLEGFHRHLNSHIKTKQTSMYNILRELINEQELIENKALESLHKDVIIKKDKMIEILNNYGN